MRVAVALGVAAAACVLATSPAAAEPTSASFVKFAGVHGGEQAGIAAPAGDVNGDGHDDVIIGAPTTRTARDRRGGAAYVVLGPFVAGTTLDLRHLGARGFVIRGVGREQAAGASVASAGDVNGDG